MNSVGNRFHISTLQTWNKLPVNNRDLIFIKTFCYKRLPHNIKWKGLINKVGFQWQKPNLSEIYTW